MDHWFVIQYAWLIPLLPLIAAAAAGFLGARWLRQNSHWPIWIGVGASAVLSLVLLAQMVGHHPAATSSTWNSYFSHAATRTLFTWIQAGSFRADAAFFIDPLTAVMLCVVTGIGFLITVFSKAYMAGEKGYFRFFAYLGLFIFMMTVLVMADNFVLLYLGWEGVGLCSYLLIGYYYDKPAPREAAKKAFLVNRVGDFGFALGIMLIFLTFDTVSFFGTPDNPGALVKAALPGLLQPWQQTALFFIPFLLMLGAFGKSAQFPLYVWLPDAMEGPSPVSALIHAATMVTAGVYMIVRCSTLFFRTPAAMTVILAVAAFTAIFAAIIALRQFDLKKVFAYSTISQLGFMFVAAAALAPVAALFHLVTHAFFKALLFLSSGVVMHAMMGELDMRRMSGLKRVLPATRWLMLIGCAALAGLIPLSGFWSKDEILIAAFRVGPLLGVVMLVTAMITAYYAFRLYFRVFEGPTILPQAPAPHHAHGHEPHQHAAASHSAIQTGTAPASGVDEAAVHDTLDHAPKHHNHEPLSMMLPLVLLAVGALAAGLLNVPGHRLGHFLGDSPSFRMAYSVAQPFGQSAVDPTLFGQPPRPGPADSHTSIMILSILAALLGILLAYLFHLKDRARADAVAAKYPAFVRLLEAKFWVDEVYQNGIVEPMRWLGRRFWEFDRFVIDGLIFAVAFTPQVFGFALKLTTQRGSLQGYALTMLIGIAILLVAIFLL